MRVDLPDSLLAAGARNEPIGTHTSKTMMLPELRALLADAPGRQSLSDYRAAAVEENVLRKSTAATRSKTFSMMRQLYALETSVALFAALRALWAVETDAQPAIALALACARDPLLRSSADLVLGMQEGEETGPERIGAEVARSFPNRYTPGVIHHIGQNVGASWAQAGLLRGRLRKRRTAVATSVPSLAYALYMGHLEGLAGSALFSSLWCRLLDASASDLRAHAAEASRDGWIEYASSGGMTEIRFSHLNKLVRAEAA